jgi:hypothetical protein
MPDPRRPLVARPVEPPLAIPVVENAPIPAGWFYARFLDYVTNTDRSYPDFRLRFLYVADPAQQRNPRWVGEALRDLVLAQRDSDSPHHRLAKAFLDLRMPAGPRKVPKALAPTVDVWSREAWMKVSDMPADFRREWAPPLDVMLSRLVVAGDRARPAEPYADTEGARRRQRVELAFAAGGVPVTAVLVQANFQMYEPGDEDHPGAVVFTPDPTVPPEVLEVVAEIIASVKGTRPADPGLAVLAEQVTNEVYVQYRRTRVPARLASGEEVYLADIDLHRDYLRGGVVRSRCRLACVAEPGEYGVLELLPESRSL